MDNKEHFDFLKSKGVSLESAESRVEKMVDRLLQSLYLPTGDKTMYSVDPDRLRLYKISNEPINWGSLHCAGAVEFKDGRFLVTVEEASPGECPTLCAYIEYYMKRWGWIVEVQTEW